MTVRNVIFLYRRRILITKGLHNKIADYFLCETRTYGLLNNRAIVCSNIKDEITFSILQCSVYPWGNLKLEGIY